MSEQIEQQIQAKGLTAPRITPARIEEVIVAAQYHIFPGTTLTVCCLTLSNGFTVVGESACASPDNFDKEIGEHIAREDAKRKIWALEGYLLREDLTGRMADRVKHSMLVATIGPAAAAALGGVEFIADPAQ